jgi:proton glutamate symport protein
MFRLALHWQILIGMLAGAAIGLGMNFTVGSSETSITEGLPAGLAEVVIEDSTDRTLITTTGQDGATASYLIDATSGKEEDFRTLESFGKKHPQLAALYLAQGQSPAHYWGSWFKRIGGLFLRLLKMVAVPLIITSLISGIMGLGGSGGVGKMFRRTILFYLTTSMLAILTGLLAVNIVKPGLRGGGQVPRGEAQIADAKGLGQICLSS